MSFQVSIAMVLIAGILQGTFVLPMTLTKNWRWEHTWAMFSLFGMLLFNWILAIVTIPQTLAIYRAVSFPQIGALILFGAGWGIGAVLFGIGMDKLGMALGYPVIMGLIASLGALIPLAVLFPGSMIRARGATIIAGTLVTILGIALCSYGASRKSSFLPTKSASDTLRIGLVVAIFAGVLSCLPNVGMALARPIIHAAELQGVPHSQSANSVWVVLFTVGFAVNGLYCGYRLCTGHSWRQYFGPRSTTNFLLCAAMGLMWIGSFYFYGIGAAGLGRWGAIIGWPVFISSSIVVGNLWGLGRGEWRGASPQSKSFLASGLVVLLFAIATVAWSNAI